MRGVVLLCLVGLVLPARALAEQTVDFETEIRPIFERHCYECHGEEKREGGLRLTNRRDAFTPGDLGIAVLTPHDAELSPLYELVTSNDEEERMPRDAPPLSPEEIERIRVWIDQGATWPEEPEVAHWAYRAPTRPPVPEVRDGSWPRNEIDFFVLARQEAADLRPNPPADPARRLRRVHLDLVGLPPTPEQVAAFVADPSPEAYERVVDDLLASPHYGERWAVHWLDLARYADSNGFQTDWIWNAWPYRDWVIRALNADMPFDRFTVQQIAGDLLPRANPFQRTATGLHRNATTSIEAGVDPDEDRVRQVVDRVNVTSTIWLGSTLECAQCHNHKYDPFSQKEFYELYAFFNNTPMEVVAMGDSEDAVAFLLKGPTVALPLSKERQRARQEIMARLGEENRRLAESDPSVDFERWKREMRASLETPVAWKPVELSSFTSSESESHRVLEDGSVVLEGPVPDLVTHEHRVRPADRSVTAIKMEILPPLDASRGGSDRKPPIVSELHVIPVRGGEEFPAVPLWAPDHAGRARRAVGGSVVRAWETPDREKSHEAVFLADEGLDDVDELLLVVEQQGGLGATIDRIRFSTTDRPARVAQLPADVAALLALPSLDPKDEARVREYYDREGRLAATDLPRLRRERALLRPVSARVMEEMPNPRETRILKRGNFLDEGAVVQPATPAVLHAFDERWPKNRLGLARWLVDPANPLVGRVTVNRWWQELFGHGLVRTPEDFGTRGEPPTHPELLDWLAVEFVESGWSMKHVLKTIVLSATYQQSSRLEERHESDPLNLLYARQERRRLPAELVRDNLLFASGLLNPAMGGPPVHPPQPAGLWNHEGNYAGRYQADHGADRYRRGVYVVWRRSSPPPAFVLFDAPDRTTCTVKRPTTNTPLQALVLMNDESSVEASIGLARRILESPAAASDRDRVAFGLRSTVARAPRPDEIEDLLALRARALERYEARPADARRLLRAAGVDVPGDPKAEIELASWYAVANVLLNLDETLTRS